MEKLLHPLDSYSRVASLTINITIRQPDQNLYNIQEDEAALD